MPRSLAPIAATLAAVLGIAIAASACSKASNESEAKQWPVPPPGKDVPIPEKLSIGLVVDGAAQPAITAQTLIKAEPDFMDEERKAWLISKLVGDAKPPGIVEATSPSGVSVKFVHPNPDGVEPVLYLTRRGEVIVAALDPKDPFPRYHGQGGRLHRAGDQMPRVAPVSKLEITRAK